MGFYDRVGKMAIASRLRHVSDLFIEDRRRIWFGRVPDGSAPGELPAADKWASVSRGMVALREGRSWSLLDVRWDDPQVVWQSER